MHHDDAPAAEQGGRGQRGQLAGPQPRGLHMAHIVHRPGRVDQARYRPFDQQVLLPHDHADAGDVRG